MWRFSRYLLISNLLLFMLILPPDVLGQEGLPHAGETGTPFFFEHFKTQDYRHYPQNWGVTQDPRGIIYVANKDGVLEYDGTSWRIIETETVVRSLTVGSDGKIYVGISGDFGYLAPDAAGSLQYRSLVTRIPPEEQAFSDVWGTHATSEGVYFQTKERLFRWDGSEITIWKSERNFHTSFVVHDRFFVRNRGTGLMEVVGDNLQPVPGLEDLADPAVFAMMPYGEDGILIGTQRAGFFIYRDGVATPFPTEADAVLNEYPLYHGCALSGGFYALATLGHGVLVIDKQGRLVHVFNKDSGFPDDWINYVYADAQGGLWMAMDATGIARVDIPSQLTSYNDQLGLDGNVESIARHQGMLYVGTSTSLLRLQQPLPGELEASSSFVGVLEGTPTPELLSVDSVLFAATHEGLFILRHGKAKEPVLLSKGVFFSLAASRRFPGEIWVGKKDGLARLYYTSEGWRLQDVYRGKARPEDEVRTIGEGQNGTLWLGAADGTVMWLHFPEEGGAPVLERFSKKDGLPGDRQDFLMIDGEVLFISKYGVYRFGREKQDGTRFYRDTSLLTDKDVASTLLLDAAQDRDGNIWIVYEDRVDHLKRQADGTYLHETPAVLRFPKSTAVGITVEDDGIVWIGNGGEIVRYDATVEKDYETPVSVLVRRMVVTRTEQVIYDGAPSALDADGPVLVYDDHDIRFEVSAPSFNDVAGLRYQYYLEGHDKAWTVWTSSATAAYHDLVEGFYKLRVRARNAQGIVSPEALFTFRILPPWYRTWWAYLIYTVFFLAGVGLAWRYRIIVEENKRAQEQARELERERDLNKRLQEANESLTQANKLKDEFLANTSHELRTPLTAILGFSALLRDELPENFTDLLDPIEENGQRLLGTLNSLLDLAQLRAGMMEVNLRPLDVSEETYETMRLLTPLAHQKKLQFEYEGPSEPIYALLDRQYYERILTNLVGNAIKFTLEGYVRVEVEQREGRVYIHVRDTGIGIEESFVPYLFDEFKQESSGMSRLHEGNGLGLAITAQLVQLMEGEIGVQSEKGKGSVFTVSFAVDTTEEETPSVAPMKQIISASRPSRSPSGSKEAPGTM